MAGAFLLGGNMNSRMPHASKITSAVDRLEVEVTTTTTYQYFYLGAHEDNLGAGGLYAILISDNTSDVDYVIEEGISKDGPFSQLATGTEAVPTVGVAHKATGVMYCPVIRVGLKHTTASGTVLLQLSSH